MKLTRRSRLPHSSRQLPDGVYWALMVALVWVMSGCSHYGYVDETKPDTDVSVWTVAAPADEGLDQARLSRVLTGAIRQHGVEARWQMDQTGPTAVSARCSVSDTDVGGFEQALFARAQVSCRVDRAGMPTEQFTASGRYVSSTGEHPSALAPSHAALQEAAAIDALESVADQIAQFMLQTDR